MASPAKRAIGTLSAAPLSVDSAVALVINHVIDTFSSNCDLFHYSGVPVSVIIKLRWSALSTSLNTYAMSASSGVPQRIVILREPDPPPLLDDYVSHQPKLGP